MGNMSTRNDLAQYLATRILALELTHPARIAFDGVDAAGKTTLADALAGLLPTISPRPVIRASIDSFHNPREARYRQGPDSPEGYYQDSFDIPALKRSLLDPLGPGGSRRIQAAWFDFRTNTIVRADTVHAAPDAVLLFDGIFLMRPELAGYWDLTIFVQVTFETVLARVIQRDRAYLGDEQNIIRRYRQRYIPAQQRYLETCRPAERADIVIGNDNVEKPDLIRG